MDLRKLELHFVNKFIIKDKRERYLNFLSQERNRKKFTSKLDHFKDFSWELLREIPGSENEVEAINSKLKTVKNISECYVISSHSEFDGKFMAIGDAINKVVGTEERF